MEHLGYAIIGRVGISNDITSVSLVVQVQGLKKYVHSNASLMYQALWSKSNVTVILTREKS